MVMLVTFVIGVLVAIVGLAMVLAGALRRRQLSGLAMTVLPLMYPFYVLFNWSNARVRNGFLVSVAGVLLVTGTMYGGVARDLPFTEVQEIADQLPSALPPTEPLANAAVADAIALPEGSKFDPLADERFMQPASPLSPQSDRPVPVEPTHEYAYYELRREHVRHYEGKVLKIVTREGKIEEGVLTGSGAVSLFLEISLPGGSAAFEHRFRDLVAVYVYDREPPATRGRWQHTSAGDPATEPTSLSETEIVGEAPPVANDPLIDRLDTESALPDAVSDLPIWAVPDMQNGAGQDPSRASEADARTPPPATSRNQGANTQPL